MEPSPGDKVKIATVKEELTGILLETSEPGIILIKLGSGYNIGIKKEDILNFELVEKQKQAKSKEIRLKSNKNLKNIDVIITGGTISSRIDYKTGAVKSLTKPEELFEFYPEIFEICNVRKIEMPFMKLSENMDSQDWKEIAKVCEKSLNDKDCEGVIITHGTDTLHYTAAALSFFLQNLNKPVVLTYAQRSSDRASSDAALNLQCAAKMAISDIAEVMIVGHADTNDNFCYALRGNKARKMHSSRRDAFKPVNTRAIAKVWADKIEIITSYKKRNTGKVRLDSSFNDKIALLKIYPGMEPEIFDYYRQKYAGIILEGTGLGHVATGDSRKNLIPAIKKAIDSGLIVCITTQTIYGKVDPYVYSSARELQKAGAIFLEDMTPETAFVKIGYVLGKTKDMEKVKQLMLDNISGELNERLEE